VKGRPGPSAVLTPAEALDVVQGEFRLGLPSRPTELPFLAIDASRASRELSILDELAPSVPCVLVAVASGWCPEPPTRFDVLVSDAAQPGPGWVVSQDLGSLVVGLSERVVASPLAALALVQLLRMGPGLSLHDAVVAESFVYSMLQAGPEFGRWLSVRSPAEPPPTDAGADPVAVSRTGSALQIELNRPQVHNALNAAMRDGLLSALHVAMADESIETVTIRGRGASFCSGGDLAEFGLADDPASAHAVRVGRSIGLTLAGFGERVSVEVHGACVGAGIEFPAFSPRIATAPDAVFMLPELGFGLVPGAGGTASIARRIGRHRAAYMALSGCGVPADRALEWGLVDAIGTAEGDR